MIRIGIIGLGRTGAGLALALEQAGYTVRLHGRSQRALPGALQATFGDSVPPWVDAVDLVLLAVPDDAIEKLARTLAATGSFGATHAVIHLSGILEVAELEAFRECGCAIGSLHPLQALSDPASAPSRLRGSTAVIDGDERAVAAAEELAQAVGLRSTRLPPGARPAYHAAAVFASNYVVVLAGVAQRLLESAGVSGEIAWQGLRSLLHGTVENLMEEDPDSALTGPVARGDVQTIRRHLAVLPKAESDLYRKLARMALRQTHLAESKLAAVEKAVDGEG